MPQDPYETLGVPRSATQDDIRKAFRALAKKHHPDLNPGDSAAEEKFKAASAANELLSDPETRARFDRGEIDASGQERAPPGGYRTHAEGSAGRRYARGGGPDGEAWSEDDLQDIFGSMFGEGRRARSEFKARGQDDQYSLTVSFLDAVNGATRRITLPDGGTLDVRIPVGTEDGRTLRLRGKGGEGWNGGPPGDALITISVEPHPTFTRDGRDIRMELPVGIRDAVLGGRVEAPTPGGTVRLRVPPASDGGTELRLKGRGVPAHGDVPAGDLYVTLRIRIGKPDAALEQFLRGWEPGKSSTAEADAGEGS
ncbi:MAG: molecular chaperone DnaJ [Ancylobacter novellus]|uniref:Molecular chaperone DnaJ n=1 Tax=Ancylobacter novellus TaxID=921 RepID=A0A2W5KFW9_ANCNO|nr:MAG: molecular chaperone DnaJ [Ancylobacter novellus]